MRTRQGSGKGWSEQWQESRFPAFHDGQIVAILPSLKGRSTLCFHFGIASRQAFYPFAKNANRGVLLHHFRLAIRFEIAELLDRLLIGSARSRIPGSIMLWLVHSACSVYQFRFYDINFDYVKFINFKYW
jgi:hypothetical protein